MKSKRRERMPGANRRSDWQLLLRRDVSNSRVSAEHGYEAAQHLDTVAVKVRRTPARPIGAHLAEIRQRRSFISKQIALFSAKVINKSWSKG